MFSSEGLVVFAFGGVAATRRAGESECPPGRAERIDERVFDERPAPDAMRRDRKAVVAKLLDAIRDDDDICCTD